MILEELSILIVEDSKDELEKFIILSQSCGLQAFGASTLDDAKQMLSLNGYDILLTDIHLGNENAESNKLGFEVIQFALESQPQLIILAMSYDLDKSVFDKALELGASHFIRKPIYNSDEILIYIKMALQKKHSKNINSSTDFSINKFIDDKSFKIFNSGVIVSAKHDKFLSGVAKNKKIPLVLFGETGTGKEEFAKILHKKRVDQEGVIPFITVNCPLLDNDLTSSLLFGHKKGAFTGANETTNGYVAAANGGILFLDEVHTLDLTTQRKLLRVLNDGNYNRVGDLRSIHSYFQLVVATTRDLDEEVEAGRMLADFKYRISGAELVLDPLRERLDDIPFFVAIFFRREKIDVSEDLIYEISEKCKYCNWKGNIRQLFRVLQRMLINAQLHEEVLNISHLVIPSNDPKNLISRKIKNCLSENKFAMNEHESHAKSLLENAFQNDCSLSETMDAIEKSILINAIKRHNSIAKAHLALGISRNAIDAKRKKYKI
ncbi:sigma-54-dependent transcriptional regulator [Silvanigrella aquatica]|uniref:HTH-type transcriptional regulatory protein TyrR n=1 Tax=Silvanigrella aquatica TaxID=1915309 RepID=A0A1L4CZ23_9BACT|nr:sigma 54-interacting transcriptional regulator [Silvanigrella aquatica]APJ03204.1 hypothetical protein AXG55_04515 [Silvanigrella aquatica]